MDWVDANPVQTACVSADQLRATSLNDTDGRFFSVGAAAEYQNGLRQGAGHHNFVV